MVEIEGEEDRHRDRRALRRRSDLVGEVDKDRRRQVSHECLGNLGVHDRGKAPDDATAEDAQRRLEDVHDRGDARC